MHKKKWVAFVLYVTISIQDSNKAYCDREMQFYFSNAKEVSLYYFCDTKLCAKHEKHVNSIYIVGIMFLK